MQSTPSNMPTSTAQTSNPSSQTQMAYEPQYYYAAPMTTGTQPYMQTAANGQTYAAPQYYQDANGQLVALPAQNGQIVMQEYPNQQFMYMQGQQGPNQGIPPNGAPQMMAPTPQPQIIYYQQPMGPMPTQAPVYYQPVPANAQMMPEQMGMPQTMQTVIPAQIPMPQGRLPGEMGKYGSARGPLTSSTPLPTSMEYEQMQRENRSKNIHFRYNRAIEAEDDYEHMLPIDEISKITIDNANDETMSAEKENHVEHHPKSEKLSRRGGGFNSQNVLSQHSMAQNQVPINYKTRLCMMHASGTKPCEMGSRCKFAHGLKELRTVEMPVRATNNKYKTKLCKNFARGGSGFCPYGLRCEFVHPTDKEFSNIPHYQRLQVDEHCSDPDMTPDTEDFITSKHQRMMQHHRSSARNSQPTKVLLKHRNVAGSMMCLSQTGREATAAGGDFNRPNNSHDSNLPPHLRANRASSSTNGMMAKLPRRVSMSQLKTKWTSEENLVRY
ncbi:unnamed protein product [Caenorhabditis bovis]|uniref:C3H1-type domain-containing protein n=1 Tax=Caenorhabditis bovis TaxID=2654633 RepID=A0A8S1F1E1_9PELO|nr:unnamed protein product [Caenorhabditis bovis]